MALQLNDEQLASFEALTGIDPGQLNDVTVAYLKSVSGSDSNDPQDLWYATLTGLGYTGAVQDMQVAYWTDILGHGGQWNDLYYEWLVTTGGAFGPSAAIVDDTPIPFCEYVDPGTDCIASGDYTAVDTGFTNPADTWDWKVIGGDGIITAGEFAKTVTIQTGVVAIGSDEVLTIRCIVTDSISTDTDTAVGVFTQKHTNATEIPVYIGPNIAQQFVSQGIPINPIETFLLFTGDALVFTLEGAWPAALVIDAGTGQITGTATDPITDYPNLTVRATNSKGFADTDPFTVTVTSGVVAPVFVGPVPAQVWQEGVAIAQFPMATYFTGTLPITYTIESGAFPVGITMNTAGQINGTPTVDGTGSVQIRATNGSGFDVTNVWGWTIWEAIVSSTIPAQSTQVNAPYSHDFSQYFTGTVSTYGINAGSWPAGLTIDPNTGIVTGTPTALFTGSASRVLANSLYEPTVQSNSFLFDVISSLIYYVSDIDGDDNDSGLTEALAWKTVAKVNATTLFAGDTVLFNRGDTWRESLLPTNSGSSGSPITFGAYGAGADPKLLGSIAKNDTGDWTDETGNIWYASSVNVIMNLIMDSESVVSTMVTTKPGLTAQGEAWYDDPNDRIYIYSVGNPSTFYNASIECAENNRIIWIEQESYVTIENLDCRYTGLDGILAKDSTAVNTDVIVDNCTVKFVGNNLLTDRGSIKLTDITNFSITNNIIDAGIHGIIVEASFAGAIVGLIDSNTITNMNLGVEENCDGMTVGRGDLAGTVISNNDISGFTDDGIDMAGGSNILFQGNTIHDNTTGGGGGDGNGIKMGLDSTETGNQVIDNYVYNITNAGIVTNSSASGLIAYNLIYNVGTDGIQVNSLDGSGGNNNYEIYNNVCYNCASRGININNGIDVGNTLNTTVRNNIFSATTQDFRTATNSVTTGGFNCLINDASVANGGVYNGAADDLYTTDPLFTDPGNDDFTLTGSSPVIDEGLDVGLTQDIIGTPVPQGSAPDMGAYEFFGSPAPTPAFYALTPDETTFEMLGVKIGTGGLTTTHTADLYAADFESVYRLFAANEAVYSGGRTVINRIRYSSDPTQWSSQTSVTLTPGLPDPAGGNTAVRVLAGAAGANLQDFNGAAYSNTIEHTGCASIYVKLVDGGPALTGTILIYDGANSSAFRTVITGLTTSWQRFQGTLRTETNDAGRCGVYISNSGDSVEVAFGQIEDITGQSVQVAGEYVVVPSTTRVAKTFANLNGNTVLNNVVTEAVGSPLAETPYLQYYPAATNAQIWSNDLTNIEWSKVTTTVAQTEVGITGEPNTATLLTATAGNALVLASGETAASGNQATCWYLKRSVGTGVIEITLDNAATWQPVVLTADYQKFTLDQAALANPVIGIRIVTSGDAVIVGNSELYLAKTTAQVRGSGPIFCTTAAVATDRTQYSFDIANWANDTAYYGEVIYSVAISDAEWWTYFTTNNNNQEGQFHHRPSTNYTRGDLDPQVTFLGDWAADEAFSVGLSAHAGDALYSARTSLDVFATAGAYSGYNVSFGSILITNTATSKPMKSREIQRFDITNFDEGKSIIDDLMAEVLVAEDASELTTETNDSLTKG